MSKKKNVSKAPREMTHRQLSHHKKQLRRQRIFLFGGIAIIVVVIGIILGGWLAGEYLPAHTTALEVIEAKFDTNFYVDTIVLLAKLQGSTSMSELAGQATNQIISTEMLIQEAGKLGVVVTDEEARQYWQNAGSNINVNDAAIHLAKGQLLVTKLKEGYFSSLVPATDNQVYVTAMLVESNAIAESLRERILNGENFTSLAGEYAQNYYAKENNGDYGWHPASILRDLLASDIPYEYAVSADAKPGDISMPLSDNASDKKISYWLIRVNERPDQDTANVSAVCLSSEEEALDIRAKLEAGAELGPIADNLSQYITSKQTHGELGLISVTDVVTDVFQEYVFNPDTEIGKWSQPLRDDALWTKGGYWLVQIVGKENRELSTEDRDSLIENLFTEWTDDMWASLSPLVINNLGTELQQWAVDQASKQL